MNKNTISFIPLLIFIGAVGVAGYFLLASPPAAVPGPSITEVVTEKASATALVEMVDDTPSVTSAPTIAPTSTSTPQPSETPTAVPTATALPSDTPVPTATPTATGTPTPTSTATNTTSPTPSATATATSTKPPPAPLADAVIRLDNGFVSLRRGPGENYEKIGELRSGDKLDVQRRVFGKDDWIKVVVNSGSGGETTGWIPTDPNLVVINVNLAEVPPMYEFGPHLITPQRFESRGIDGLIEFHWEPVAFPLEEYQYYSLLLVQDGLPDDEACYHWQTKETVIMLTPEDYDCSAGAYTWRVGLATDLNKGIGERNWRDDSEFDEKNPIGIGIPHPGRPSDGSGGGSGNSGVAPPPN